MSGEEKTRGMKGLPPDAGERAGRTKRRRELLQAADLPTARISRCTSGTIPIHRNGDLFDLSNGNSPGCETAVWGVAAVFIRPRSCPAVCG